jgi:hypothetical protein
MAGAALAAGLLAAACGSGSTSSSAAGASASATSPAASAASPSTASANSPLCQDAAALRASLDKLKHVTIGAGTADEIKADVGDVKSKLSAVKTEAHGQWQAQISALEDSLAKLQSSVKSLTSNPGASTISGTVSALRGVAASGSSLLAALSQQCPSASASPST